MKYTKEEILGSLQYVGRSYVIPVYSKLFERYVVVTISLNSGDRNRDITENVVDCVNMFLNTNKSLIKLIKKLTFENYQAVISDCSYGFISDELLEKHNGDCGKANQEYFGYKNGTSAFRSCNLREIYIEGEPYGEPPLFYTLSFETPWDHEHGIRFSIRENEILYVE